MKKILIFLSLFLTSGLLFAQVSNFGNNNLSQTVTSSGIGLGSVISVAISWSRNKSILWAILHGILGWIYVIYYAIIREYENK